MSKPFDASTKHLIHLRPADWLEFAGYPRAEVEILDADLSSISAASDKVLRVLEPEPWLFHLELQASYESDMIERFHVYSVLEYRLLRLPVKTVVVLLRPQADGPNVTGELEYFWPGGVRYEWFKYEVIRVWERSVEDILTGGLATLPLAPLTDVKPEALPEVIRRMDARLQQETSSDEAEEFWTATYLLMGLRYPPALARQLLQGVRNMRESTTYQAILEEGRAEGEARGETRGRATEARKNILVLGSRRFGVPSTQTEARLQRIEDVALLERLVERLLDVENWNELLSEE